MRPWLTFVLLLVAAGVHAQGSQDVLRNVWSTDSNISFNAQIRQYDEERARQMAAYRESMRESWKQQPTPVPMTPQRARIEQIGDQLQATHRASAADLTEAGMDWYFGDGVPRNAEAGLYFIGLAADANSFNWHYAQFVLGNIYWYGQGTKPAKPAALDWYRKSAANGNVLAMSQLALFLAVGADVPKDLDEAGRWIDALETKLLFRAGAAETDGTPVPGEIFADDEQRATAAMLIATISVARAHDTARGLYWMERAGRWGCQECAEVMSGVEYSSSGLPSAAAELGLTVLGVRIVVPPYRGQWAAGTMNSNGQAKQGMRLDPGTPAGKMFAVLEPEAGDCSAQMIRLELSEGLARVSLPALYPDGRLFKDWHAFALEGAPGSYTLCRDAPSGHMLVLLVAADPDQPDGWLRLAFDQSRPIVDEIVREMKH